MMTSARQWLATRVVLPLSHRVSVAEALLGAIGSGHGIERVTELAWREGGVVHAERKASIATQRGKIRHFHLERVLGSAGPPRSRA